MTTFAAGFVFLLAVSSTLARKQRTVKCFQRNVLTFPFHNLESYQSCSNPNGKSGSCRPVRLCPALVNLLSAGNLSPDNRNFLQRSQCGFVNNEPWVCCAGNESTTEPTSRTTSGPRKVTLPKTPNCGLYASDRIYRYEETHIDEHPWTAQIEYQKRE